MAVIKSPNNPEMATWYVYYWLRCNKCKKNENDEDAACFRWGKCRDKKCDWMLKVYSYR